jgi:outer membrane protein with glycine zipper
MADTNKRNVGNSNPDPITGAPGSHPVGTGIGAAGGGATGAAIGSMAGPVGTVVGAAVGAVAGGLAGKAAAEAVDPTAEDAYWRENYRNRPYADSALDYDTYAPAYRHGWESKARYPGRKFSEVEPEVATGWSKSKGSAKLGWDKAKHATRDAWDRIERALPGDSDGDGK